MMGDPAISINPPQTDAMMQHSLAMVQNQNRKFDFCDSFRLIWAAIWHLCPSQGLFKVSAEILQLIMILILQCSR